MIIITRANAAVVYYLYCFDACCSMGDEAGAEVRNEVRGAANSPVHTPPKAANEQHIYTHVSITGETINNYVQMLADSRLLFEEVKARLQQRRRRRCIDVSGQKSVVRRKWIVLAATAGR